jgi:hypothetical protein
LSIDVLHARQFFAAVNGLPNNPGTYTQPWALDTALRMPASRVTGGDTVWLRGGLYSGTFTASISGTVAKPVVLQAYPGEHVRFDSYKGLTDNVVTITMNGNYVWLIDVEISNSSPTRVSNASGVSTATDIHQSTGINIFGVGTKVINCSIHDCPGTGIGYWSSALDAEVYGSFIFYNGFSALDRGHGPSFYVQNTDAARPKSLRNCFVFSGFSTGVQFYASATSKKLQGLIVDSCTIFNQGALTRPTQARRRNILAGAETSNLTNDSANATRVDGLYITNNVLYRDTTDNISKLYWPYDDYRENTELGYQDELLSDKFLSFRKNHLYGDPLPLKMHNWDSGVFKQNFIYSYRANTTGNRDVIELANGTLPFLNWDSNRYHINQPTYSTPFSGRSFSSWKADFKIDSNSSFVNGPPTENFVYVRRNKYRTNSFYITVMNYLQLDSVMVGEDFSAFAGMNFSIFDVQLDVRKPFSKGEYNGQQINLPLTKVEVAATTGITPMPPKHTSKTMGTFLITFYPKEKTVKAGNWNDASVWDKGRVPDHFDDVELLHPLTIEGLAWCRSFKANGQLVHVKNGAQLLISNMGN